MNVSSSKLVVAAPFSSGGDSSSGEDKVVAVDGLNVKRYKDQYYRKAEDQSNLPTRSDKYKIARKRANILLSLVNTESLSASISSKPKVFNTPFERGDAIEVEYASSMDTKTRSITKFRGLVLGRTNKGLASSFTIRDVVLEETVERTIPLHSPLLLGVRVLEKNWIGKKRIRRAKLTYLRDRPDVEVNVSGWKGFEGDKRKKKGKKK
ncbi:hypothetical protein TL16_g12797 [Triparma laevis f. inornata]|uniref:50S ribosomal protein L19, chloroplastic n=1 Tax=Triparma laevis f. inornata TaxID=1714386 RepID=A0A9W7BP89_9STRA|nr:hypothetical protein TL16_g12797 [Triparma laevis f. inornata]